MDRQIDLSRLRLLYVLLILFACLFEVRCRNLKSKPSPYSVDCLRVDSSGDVPNCDPEGEKNVCCFGLDCIPVVRYKESEAGKLIEVKTHKCINKFQANVPGSPLCLKTDKNGIFPICNPKVDNGNCCMGLTCIENPARKGEFRCANKIELNFSPIGGDLSKPGGGYDPSNYIPNPSQYVPGDSSSFIPAMLQNTLDSTGDSDCISVGEADSLPMCDPEALNGNCCAEFSCIESPVRKGEFRCGTFVQSHQNTAGMRSRSIHLVEGQQSITTAGIVAVFPKTNHKNHSLATKFGHRAGFLLFSLICVALCFTWFRLSNRSQYTRIP
mmetsp:Transcript_3734/g.4990  ORF Transcript_3734/g.4990 Transcript_3734/m.4990 type:complete len:326 (-) Transcript_3734:1185-2162(-)